MMVSPLSLSSDSDCQLPTAQPMDQLLTLVLGTALPIFVFGLVILMYMMYRRRQTRDELEGGKCNLPTVVWRPRFMNYTTQDDGTDEDDFSRDSDDDIMEWAKTFVEEHHSTQQQPDVEVQGTTTLGTIPNNNKKMGSSSITNILPRMERLNGPYGMYATVYGIQTKVVHVAHPVPARAILTGAGVVDIAGMGMVGGGGHENKQFPFSWKSALRIIKSTVTNRTDAPSSKKHEQKRRRSSSLRMLTGSTKYPAYDHFKNFSGEGVFTANGADWKAKRASVIHCLLRNGTTEQSLEMEANRAADSFEREVAACAASIKSSRGKNNESGNHLRERKSPVMNVVPMLQRSTIGLIYRLITHQNGEFSPDFIGDVEKKCPDRQDSTSSDQSGSLTSSSSVASLASMGGEANNDEALPNDTTATTNHTPTGCHTRSKYNEQEARIKSLLPTYLQSVTKIRMIVLAQSRSFWYLLPRSVYKAFSPMYREEERTMGPIREFAQLTCENAMPGSPLALLSQRNSHSPSHNNGAATNTPRQNNIPANVSKDLLDEAITLLFAGQDTSAATLSWTLHLLSLHPDKQERVAKEVRSVLDGKSETNKPILKSMISQMPYLDAVIKESMRLYPVAPFIVRKLTTDITIPNDKDLPTNNHNNKTISMPASTFACIWIYALHRNPKLWDQPNEFLPERWIDPTLRSRDLGQEEYGAYMPFAIGPRNCLGQPLAQVILRILLARIVNMYVVLDPKLVALQALMGDEKGGKKKVEFDSKCLRKDMQAGFTVLPSNGLKLQLMERI